VKKICMVCQSYYLRDPRVRREAEALADAGFMIDIITLKDKGERSTETVNRVNIYRLPIMRKRGGMLRYLFEYLSFFLLLIKVCKYQFYGYLYLNFHFTYTKIIKLNIR
jgi:hypothetical protein